MSTTLKGGANICFSAAKVLTQTHHHVTLHVNLPRCFKT